MEGFCELRINCSAEALGSSRKLKLDKFQELNTFAEHIARRPKKGDKGNLIFQNFLVEYS